MKKIRIILIISIVALIISIIGLTVYSINKKKFSEEKYTLEKPLEEALEGKLYPNNFTEFYFKYNGSISTNDIYTKLYDIIEVGIPRLNSDVEKLYTDEKISDYYDNQSYVKNVIGISSKIDFIKLVKILKENDVTALKYSISEIEKLSTTVYSNKTEFILTVQYEHSQPINLKVIVYNTKKNNGFINIIPIIDENQTLKDSKTTE